VVLARLMLAAGGFAVLAGVLALWQTHGVEIWLDAIIAFCM